MDDSFCASCARQGSSCCQNTEIYCTPGDRRRIAAALGGRDDFHERRRSAFPDQIPDAEAAAFDPPWAALFARHGERDVLKHRPNDDCVFLSPTGCALDMETRPLICRLYPFSYNHEAIVGVDACRCPQPASDNGALALALIGMDRERAEDWRHMLYKEIAEDLEDRRATGEGL